MAVFEKGIRLRHIGHLDIQRAMMRALRRSGLPVAYSNGYNPHILLTFASALSTGAAGKKEILDVTMAREVFSNTGNSNMNRWQTYVKGDPKRQAILETALDWVSEGEIDEYMASHRNDTNIDELKRHFDTVIDWVDKVFEYTGSEMCGLDWGRLYREYHKNAYSKDKVAERVEALLDDSQVTDKKGIFEYILGGEKDERLLNIRVFDKKTIKSVYRKQTADAKANDTSNCPLCALGHDANAKRIYKETEMDADHVTAWSRGGATDEANCQMLCKTHNRAKGNR